MADDPSMRAFVGPKRSDGKYSVQLVYPISGKRIKKLMTAEQVAALQGYEVHKSAQDASSRRSRLHRALDAVMDRAMAKAADGALRGLSLEQGQEVVKHADKMLYAALSEGFSHAQAQEVANAAAKKKAAELRRLNKSGTSDITDAAEYYKLYSASLRRHLEVRAPMLEASSEDITQLKATSAWKTMPSVITDENGKIVESNNIG